MKHVQLSSGHTGDALPRDSFPEAPLVAIMDWASRRVLAWRLSNTMDTEFCLEALTADEELLCGRVCEALYGQRVIDTFAEYTASRYVWRPA